MAPAGESADGSNFAALFPHSYHSNLPSWEKRISLPISSVKALEEAYAGDRAEKVKERASQWSHVAKGTSQGKYSGQPQSQDERRKGEEREESLPQLSHLAQSPGSG